MNSLHLWEKCWCCHCWPPEHGRCLSVTHWFQYCPSHWPWTGMQIRKVLMCVFCFRSKYWRKKASLLVRQPLFVKVCLGMQSPGFLSLRVNFKASLLDRRPFAQQYHLRSVLLVFSIGWNVETVWPWGAPSGTATQHFWYIGPIHVDPLHDYKTLQSSDVGFRGRNDCDHAV